MTLSYNMIKSLVKKFERKGDLNDDTDGMRTKMRTVRTPEVIEQAREMVERDSGISTRNLARNLDTSYYTSHKILREDLKKYLYKSQLAQSLSEKQKTARKEFAAEFCQKVDEKTLNSRKIIFSDEAHFWLDGYVNKQNSRVWGSERPEALLTRPLHPKKTSVWCAINDRGIIGPKFIRNKTIDAKVYGEILDDYLPKAHKKGLVKDYTFQQDGSTSHTIVYNLNKLKSTYGDRVISKKFPQKCGGGMEWPANSPDITPMDFFVWGYTKDKVYKDRPKTLEELETKIERTVCAIPAKSCCSALDSVVTRMRTLCMGDGDHIEKSLNKK